MMTHFKKLLFIVLIAILSACSSLPEGFSKEESYLLSDTQSSALGEKAATLLGEDTETSQMYLLNEGLDAFFSRMFLLKNAERSIDVQYFIWHADLIGKLLFNEILIAADRGVRVRILLDDINIDDQVADILTAMDQHENITVHLFNPFTSRSLRFTEFITDGYRVNRRMHNKSFTVDGQVTVVGGRNIGSEYFAADEESNFTDIDVMAIGPIVMDIEKQFDLYFNSEAVYPINAFDYNHATTQDLDRIRAELLAFREAKETSKYAKDIRNSKVFKYWKQITTDDDADMNFIGNVKVIYDDPNKGLDKDQKDVVYLKSLMKPHLERVQHTFELISPYFVPGDQGTEYLVSLVKKGINVRVITNSLSSTDGVMAQSGYARHRVELLQGGVEIYELKADAKTDASRSLSQSGKAKSGLHAKIYIFDREEVFVGSFNFDQRSANINSEVGVIYQIPKMAHLIAHESFDVEAPDFAYKVELVVKKDKNGKKHLTDDVVWIEMKDGKEYRYDTDPNTSLWRRMNENIFSVLPIESQL
jgi:putative cardiolipin synthase